MLPLRGKILAGMFSAFIVAALLLSGCSRGYSRFLKLPADPSVSMGLGWAVVTSAYAQVKLLPDKDSPEATLVREDTLFQCFERRIDPKGQDVGGLWYKYGDAESGGWIHSDDLSIFSSEEQARDAIAALRK